MLLALGASPAVAADFNVNSGNVADLIEAINTANGNEEADTIFLDGSTFILSVLDNTSPNGPNGLPVISSEIIIEGNGSTIQRSSQMGTPDFRILEVNETGNLTLNNTVITNGNLGEELDTALNEGAGIHLDSGILTINESTISGNNTADSGAGIYSNSQLTINNSTISGNTAANSGGGILNYLSETNLTDTILSGNSANIGGGIYSFNAEANISDSTVTGNDADMYGGGISLGGGSTVTVTGTTISGNTANNFGGGFDTYNGTLNLSNSTVSGNSGTNFGGGVDLSENGIATIINSTISGNSTDGAGGGIDNYDGRLTMFNSTVTGNTADTGGGIFNAYTDGYGIATITSCIVSGNTADTQGAELFNSNGTINPNTFNIFAHSGLTDMQAFGGFLPTMDDINASSDDENIPLENIIDTNLIDNGGPTLTHAIPMDSPAIDGIPDGMCLDPDDMTLATDQRDLPRPDDGDDDGVALCDIGAFELQVGDGSSGCSITKGQVNTRSSLSNSIMTLVPGVLGFFGLYRRRKKTS